MSTPLKEAKDCCKAREPAKWAVIYEDDKRTVAQSDDGFVLQTLKNAPTTMPVIYRRSGKTALTAALRKEPMR